jgi:hypothetical protein
MCDIFRYHLSFSYQLPWIATAKKLQPRLLTNRFIASVYSSAVDQRAWTPAFGICADCPLTPSGCKLRWLLPHVVLSSAQRTTIIQPVFRRANNFGSSCCVRTTIEPLNPYVGFAARENILMYCRPTLQLVRIRWETRIFFIKPISKSDIL